MKGSQLCSMYNLKIPIPPGFIITVEACQELIKYNTFPKDHRFINEHIEKVYELERITGKQFGGKLYSKLKKNRRFPLLLSVRCAAIYPNPTRGLMETILVILSLVYLLLSLLLLLP